MEDQTITRRLLEAQHNFLKAQKSVSFPELSKSEFYMLEGIASADGIYVSEIAKKLRISPPAVSKMLKSLEEKKYIERKTDPRDRRNTAVRITPEGDRIRKGVHAKMEALMRNVIGRMGEEDTEKLIQLLVNFTELIHEESTKLKKMQEEQYEADF